MKIVISLFSLLIGLSGMMNAQTCIIANYPFDSSAADITGNGYGGTVMGASLAPDRYGNPNSAYLFNGATDYIELNNNFPVITHSDFSISAWTQVLGPGGGVSGFNQVFNQRSDNTINTAAIGLVATDNLGNTVVAVRGQGGSTELVTAAYPNDTAWHHLVGVVDSAAGQLLLYIDGSLVNTSNYSQAGGNFTAGVDYVAIGRQFYQNASQGQFNGSIDDVQIYDCALTENEVIGLFTNLDVSEIAPAIIKVFPNPANQVLRIQGIPKGEVTGALLNAMGQEVKKINAHEEIDVHGLAQGVYMLRLTDVKGRLFFTRKILISR